MINIRRRIKKKRESIPRPLLLLQVVAVAVGIVGNPAKATEDQERNQEIIERKTTRTGLDQETKSVKTENEGIPAPKAEIRRRNSSKKGIIQRVEAIVIPESKR